MQWAEEANSLTLDWCNYSMNSNKSTQQFLMWLSTLVSDRWIWLNISHLFFQYLVFLFTYPQANFDRRAAMTLLDKESSTFSRTTAPTKKMSNSSSTTGSNLSSPSSPHPSPRTSNGFVNNNNNMSQTGAAAASRVPPALPVSPPVGGSTGYTSPPVYNSPLYRPDIDLSLPPQVKFFF